MSAKTLAGLVKIRLMRLAKHFPKPYRQILEQEASALEQVVEELAKTIAK
jgi:hypothetical protein